MFIKSFTVAIATVFSVTCFATTPIEMIVPFPAGGPSDVTARLIAKGFVEEGIPMIVVNKTGGSGIVGTNHVAEAKPDGKTLLLGGSGANFMAIINKTDGVKYTEKSFDPVILVGTTPSLLLVNSNIIKSTNFTALTAELKDNPKLAQVGTTTETTKFAAKWLFSLGKTNADLLPYNGSAQGIKDLLGGHIPMLMDIACPSLNTVKGHAHIQPILVASTKRLPTELAIQSGVEVYPEYTMFSWFAVFAPAGTPTTIITEYNKVINKILKNAEYKDKLENCYTHVSGGTPTDFKNFIKSEHKKFSSIK